MEIGNQVLTNLLTTQQICNIAETLQETLEQWDLEPKNQTCITTDNGSNILCAV